MQALLMNAKVTMPATGGKGALIAHIIGMLLIGLAGVLYVIYRNKRT